MSDSIEYGNLMHDAMRSLVQQVLTSVAKTGKLPGDHHFFITFDTLHPDVEMADWLSDRYPGEMTVVMQHWFDNLDVGETGFSVTLNFGDQPEPIYIPFMAIKTFVDPSVEFGLRFEANDDDTDEPASPVELVRDEPDAAASVTQRADKKDADDTAAPETGGTVVSLDSFRKP
ncbi:MAG: ClpXP protease specificity-enhancing factor SspB [Pseudomonadota bacterium]